MKKRIITAAVSVIVFGFAVSGAFAYLFVRSGEGKEVVEIPDFSGKREEDIAESRGIEIEKEYIYSSEFEIGEIIMQMPFGGMKKKINKGEKCKVTVTVSLGEKSERMPDLAMLQEEQAMAILRGMGAVAELKYLRRNDIEDGRVIYSSPNEGEEIKQGDRVILYVSERAIKATARVGCYLMLGENEAAVKTLMDGLVLDGIDKEYSTEPEGTVIKQSIPENSYVLRGSGIRLTVSLGDITKTELYGSFSSAIEEE